MQITSKAALRKQMLRIRAELSGPYCQEADRAILEKLMKLTVYRQADTLFLYVSMEDEVDTRKLLEHAFFQGKTVAVPRCLEKGVMGAYLIRNTEELRPGKYGIPEPQEGCRKINPKEIALAIIPCLACSEQGVRLGYGGGYYDRYLPQTDACKIVLCRERMLCDHIPSEPHDCPVDFIITEKRIFTKNPEIHLL